MKCSISLFSVILLIWFTFKLKPSATTWEQCWTRQLDNRREFFKKYQTLSLWDFFWSLNAELWWASSEVICENRSVWCIFILQQFCQSQPEYSAQRYLYCRGTGSSPTDPNALSHPPACQTPTPPSTTSTTPHTALIIQDSILRRCQAVIGGNSVTFSSSETPTTTCMRTQFFRNLHKQAAFQYVSDRAVDWQQH